MFGATRFLHFPMKAHRHSEVAAAQVTLCDPWQLRVKPTSTQPPTSRSPVQNRCASISPSLCIVSSIFIPPQTKHRASRSNRRRGGGGVRGTSDFSRLRSHPLQAHSIPHRHRFPFKIAPWIVVIWVIRVLEADDRMCANPDSGHTHHGEGIMRRSYGWWWGQGGAAVVGDEGYAMLEVRK